MKFLFCPDCHDVVKLKSHKKTECDCKRSYATLDDKGRVGKYHGKSIPMCIANTSLYKAIEYTGKNPNTTSETTIINAWVMNKETETIKLCHQQNPHVYAYKEWEKRRTIHLLEYMRNMENKND